MNGGELYILTTEFLGGTSLDEILFYQILNMKKDVLEMERDWMILRTFDSTITFTSSDDYTSTKTLPDRFLRVYTPFDDMTKAQTGVYIVDSSGNKIPLKPIAFARRFDFKDVEGYYYLDIKNRKIGRTGTTAGTLHIFFLQGTAEITESSTWEFPTWAHPLLAYFIAIEQKGGIDWDTINANQVPYNNKSLGMIERNLNMWDARLQQSELGI